MRNDRHVRLFARVRREKRFSLTRHSGVRVNVERHRLNRAALALHLILQQLLLQLVLLDLLAQLRRQCGYVILRVRLLIRLAIRVLVLRRGAVTLVRDVVELVRRRGGRRARGRVQAVVQSYSGIQVGLKPGILRAFLRVVHLRS